MCDRPVIVADMREVKSTNGRILAVEEWGVPAGIPIVSVCGSPLSRLARYPDLKLFWVPTASRIAIAHHASFYPADKQAVGAVR